MWKMFDDMIECNECGGLLGPPPKFMIPPPPRPPSMGEYSISNCNEEEMAIKAQQAWDSDICEAIPILDASLYSSQSLQTSAMIAVLSLLLVLVVLISSLFVWKNKRKVQNFLPCKTPTRGPHINGGLPIGSGHSVTYEDPDANLGHHRPLVMRHHHNVEIMHGKSIHYPSGYPMTRSPPFLVSSSPGPDPYRSNDNVYEELGPGRDSDGESEPPLHSDDDFAEDELSLPGEHSFNKSQVSESTSAVAALAGTYPAATAASTSNALANVTERNSVLSSSSSTQDNSTATAHSSTSSHNNNSSANGAASGCHAATLSNSNATRSPGGGLLTGMMRHTTGRNKSHANTNGARAKPEQHKNVPSANSSPIDPIQRMYDNRSNLMGLGYMSYQPHAQQQPLHGYHHHSLHQINNNGRPSNPQFYNTLENEVERRNRLNNQLSHNPAIATIFQERIHYPNSGRYPQPYYTCNSSMRGARFTPRAKDRRQRVTAPLNTLEPSYGYAEPVYHENYNYEACPTSTLQQRLAQPLPYGHYSTADYPSSGSGSSSYRPQNQLPASNYQNGSQLYSRGDSSFGSDSGYSHHTPASSIGRHDYDEALPLPATAGRKTPSKLTTALNFGWNRRKSTPNIPASLQVSHQAPSSMTPSSGSGAEATSPNNNSGSSTITSTLENTSTASNSSAAAGPNNNKSSLSHT